MSPAAASSAGPQLWLSQFLTVNRPCQLLEEIADLLPTALASHPATLMVERQASLELFDLEDIVNLPLTLPPTAKTSHSAVAPQCRAEKLVGDLIGMAN